MPRVSRSAILTLYFIVFVDFFQLSFVFPLLPKIVQGFGGGATEIGLLGSVAAAGEGLAAPLLGMLADRVGRRPVFVLGMCGCLFGNLLTGFAGNFPVMLFARLIDGVFGGTVSVAGAYLADVTSPEERPTYMTHFEASIFLGLSIGPVIGVVMDHLGGWQLACFFASGVCALNLLTLRFLPDSKSLQSPESSSDEERVKGGGSSPRSDAPSAGAPCMPMVAWIVCLAALLNHVGFTTFESLGVLFIEDAFFGGRAAPATVFWSFILSSIGAVGLIVNLFLYAPMERRIGLKGTVVLGGGCAALGYFCIGLPLNKWWFFVWTQVLVAGTNVASTSTQTILTLVVHPSQYGKAMGWMTCFQNVARALGPFVFGPVYQHFSKLAPWFANSAFKVMAVLIIVYVPLAMNQEEKQCPPADGNLELDLECPAEAVSSVSSEPDSAVPVPDGLRGQEARPDASAPRLAAAATGSADGCPSAACSPNPVQASTEDAARAAKLPTEGGGAAGEAETYEV